MSGSSSIHRQAGRTAEELRRSGHHHLKWHIALKGLCDDPGRAVTSNVIAGRAPSLGLCRYDPRLNWFERADEIAGTIEAFAQKSENAG